jgi:alpha-beta hydrolase superfamily lysophospholipase
VSLHWDPDGPARGRVALLHGMMSTAATWWRIGPALAAMGWSVDALDLPGHGDWPRPARPLAGHRRRVRRRRPRRPGDGLRELIRAVA